MLLDVHDCQAEVLDSGSSKTSLYQQSRRLSTGVVVAGQPQHVAVPSCRRGAAFLVDLWISRGGERMMSS